MAYRSESGLTGQLRRHFDVYGDGGPILAVSTAKYYFVLNLRDKDHRVIGCNTEGLEALQKFRAELVKLTGECTEISLVKSDEFEFWRKTADFILYNVYDGYHRELLRWAAYNGEFRQPKEICPDPENVAKLLNHTPPYPYRQ